MQIHKAHHRGLGFNKLQRNLAHQDLGTTKSSSRSIKGGVAPKHLSSNT